MVLNQLGSGALSSAEAAALMGVSERQVRRPRRAYATHCAKALAHGNRGRRPVNAADLKPRRRMATPAKSAIRGSTTSTSPRCWRSGSRSNSPAPPSIGF